MPRKGETLHNSVKEVIYKVIQFCQREKEEKQNIIDVNKVTERVAAMSGLSASSVARIKKEGLINNGVWSPTPTRKSSGRPKKIILNDSDKCAIKNKIGQFYTINEVPTLRKLHKVLKEDDNINFAGGVSTLRTILKEIGFQYKKCQAKKETPGKRAKKSVGAPTVMQNLQTHKDVYHSVDLRMCFPRGDL